MTLKLHLTVASSICYPLKYSNQLLKHTIHTKIILFTKVGRFTTDLMNILLSVYNNNTQYKLC